MFNAMHMSIAPFFSKKGGSAADRWKNKIIREMKKLLGIRISTVWDRIEKKAKKI